LAYFTISHCDGIWHGLTGTIGGVSCLTTALFVDI